MNTQEAEVQTRVDGTCGTIVLKQPARRNAVTRAMLRSLIEAFGDLHQQARVRGVILTGSGDCFCAGTDLYELRESQASRQAEPQWFDDANLQREVLTTILRFPKPVIAAVNGPALGLGLSLVAACDLALGTPEATFGLPEPQRGLTAGVAIPLLAFRLGASSASQLLLRGQTFDASQAQHLGLIQKIVEFNHVWLTAQQWVHDIAKSSSVSISMTKRVLNETVGEALLAQLAVAAAATASVRTTDDAHEGINAFLEKRAPNWE